MQKKGGFKELLERGVEEIISRASLLKKLKSGEKLRIKHGVDPTTKDLHIGYAVVYHKLRQFQELGHRVIFLIGDFTARFGDPTGETKARKLRDKKEVEENVQNYINQIGKILDTDKLEIRRNSEWFDKFSGEDMLRLESRFTVSRMLERDMFQGRIQEKDEIAYHEPVYPMLQAYDSVMLKSDATVIGSDQRFNELQARKLQREEGQDPQDLMIMSLLIGTDGKQKMSQSLGNYIGIAEPPFEQYGKAMSIPDDIIFHYFRLATFVPEEEIGEMGREIQKGANPRDAKARLAREVVAIYHGKEKAIGAEAEFNRVFQKKETPIKIPEKKIESKKYQAQELLVNLGLAESKSEAKRLIEQGGVSVNKKRIEDPFKEIEPKEEMLVQVGKRRFCKIKL